MKKWIVLTMLIGAGSAYSQQPGPSQLIQDIMNDPVKREFYETEMLPMLERQYRVNMRRMKKLMESLPDDMDKDSLETMEGPDMRPTAQEIRAQQDRLRVCKRAYHVLGKQTTGQLMMCSEK